MNEDFYNMIIRGTGEDDYEDDDEEYEFSDYLGDGSCGGARRKSSSYNSFVKKYSKKHGLSIPEAAHEIKRKGLWKGTSKKKYGSKTGKRKARGSKMSKRKSTRRKVSKSKSTRRKVSKSKSRKVGRRRKVGRPRGRGYFGGATIEDLEKYIKDQQEEKKDKKKERAKKHIIDKLACEGLKRNIKGPNSAKYYYEKCNDLPTEPKVRLTKEMKEYLLEHYLENADF